MSAVTHLRTYAVSGHHCGAFWPELCCTATDRFACLGCPRCCQRCGTADHLPERPCVGTAGEQRGLWE